MYDLIIIGSGPAGMTAAIYAARANLNVAIIEKSAPGGQMINTNVIENYPGRKGSGVDIALEMLNQVEELNVEMIYDEVKEIRVHSNFFEIQTENVLEAKTVLVASGMKPRRLNIYNEDKFMGRGISFCAICDGSFYKDEEVVVIGGGNSALEESLYLANICKKVTIVQRSVLRAMEKIQEEVYKEKNIEVLTNTIPISFEGDSSLKGLRVKDEETERVINAKGAFIYIGHDPVSSFVPDSVKNEKGFINVNDHMETVIPGLFAAGDIINKEIRQVVTATNDGAIAAIYISRYLKERR